MLRWFFAGLLIGLAVLSLAGGFIAQHDFYQAFKRFHRNINPETYYYPTASQSAGLALSVAAPGKTVVVVGGNSIVFGSGQGEQELWTEALKTELGDSFAVVNLALPSGQPTEHGAVAAQELIKRRVPVIYTAPVYPGLSMVPDGQRYSYVVWDAEARGMLVPFAARDSMWDESRLELRLRAQLDRVLNFTDLWTSVSYLCCNLVWNSLLPHGSVFLGPRSALPDQMQFIPDFARYPAGQDEGQIQLLQREVQALCVPDAQHAAHVEATTNEIQAAFPLELAERSLFMIFDRSPRFTRLLTEEQRDCRRAMFRDVSDALARRNVRSVIVGSDWSDEDFVDILHPSPEGGRKLAHQLAAALKEWGEMGTHTR